MGGGLAGWVRRLGGNYTKVGKQGREFGEQLSSQFLGRQVGWIDLVLSDRRLPSFAITPI